VIVAKELAGIRCYAPAVITGSIGTYIST